MKTRSNRKNFNKQTPTLTQNEKENEAPKTVLKRCGKCHQFKNPTGQNSNKLSPTQRQKSHFCSEEDVCTSWITCPVELEKRSQYHKTPTERAAITAAKKQIKV